VETSYMAMPLGSVRTVYSGFCERNTSLRLMVIVRLEGKVRWAERRYDRWAHIAYYYRRRAQLIIARDKERCNTGLALSVQTPITTALMYDDDGAAAPRHDDRVELWCAQLGLPHE
jgi:hypothetical protein